MKANLITTLLLLFEPLVLVMATPAAVKDALPLAPRFRASYYANQMTSSISNNDSERLFRRKGGGGDGGSGGGGHGGRGGGGDSGGSDSASDSSANKGAGSPSSNTGGRTTTGSGELRSYGGCYPGGASQPYRSGETAPSGMVPVALGAAAGATIAGLTFWPGLWYHPIYYYPYSRHCNFFNQSSGKNESKAVGCGCDETVECSCDDNTNSTYLNSLIGNGSYGGLNKSVITVGDVNGTETLLINGTLANGTTAPGGNVSPNAGDGSMRALLQHAKWWPAAAIVVAMVIEL